MMVQSISPRSRYYAVWESLTDGRNTLCVSNEIITEYLEILQRLTDYDTAETIIKTIINSKFVELITPFYRFELIQQDPDDNKFVDCAITAGATYIVSNDRHFAELEKYDFPKVAVRNLSQFLEIVRNL